MSPASYANVLILTPVKDASHHLDRFFELILAMEYPKERLALGILEGDSRDDTFVRGNRLVDSVDGVFRRASIWKKDMGFHLPNGVARYDDKYQLARRTALAKSRNHLLLNALEHDDDWVLWVDVDLVDYPTSILLQLLASGFDIVQPDCLSRETLATGASGQPSFDLNAWCDQGRLHMHDLRGSGGPVELHSVGGTMLLVRADVHRDGLIFPPFRYGLMNARIRPTGANLWNGEIETEGLGIMANDMGVSCWGLPNVRTIHA
jgi:glycosyltransferase involved in cell wall biosynthesis